MDDRDSGTWYSFQKAKYQLSGNIIDFLGPGVEGFLCYSEKSGSEGDRLIVGLSLFNDNYRILPIPRRKKFKCTIKTYRPGHPKSVKYRKGNHAQ